MNNTPQGFDALAKSYDTEFTDTLLGRLLRKPVWDIYQLLEPSGKHFLELGCGTGEDACFLAQCGAQVTATDPSEQMLEVTEGKARTRGLDSLVHRVCCTAEEAASALGSAQYDGIVSNFGALNAVADASAVIDELAARVRPGGTAVIVLMGPHCPWEWLFYWLQGNREEATRRRRAGLVTMVAGKRMLIRYPSRRSFVAALGPQWRHEFSRGLGILLPPSYLNGVVGRHPAISRLLSKLDQLLGRMFPSVGDHYIVVLKRIPQ